MIYIHLLALAFGYFLGRGRAVFIGTDAATADGLTYKFKTDTHERKVIARHYGVAGAGMPTLAFWPERWTDRFFKSVRLVREFSCDDPEFDAQVFVGSANPAVRQALAKSPDLRQAVRRLLDDGAIIQGDSTTVWAGFPATPFSEAGVPGVVGDLHLLASAMAGLTDTDAELKTMRRESLLRGTAGAAFALAATGGVISCFQLYVSIRWKLQPGNGLADDYVFFVRFLPESIALLAAFLVVTVTLLAGRSPYAHKLFVAGLGYGVFVAPLAVFFLARDVNVALDFSPVQVSTQPIIKFDAGATTGRYSDRATLHPYAVLKSIWPGISPVEFSITENQFYKVRKHEIDQATVRWHPGFLGGPWIEDVTLAAPRDTIESRIARCDGGDMVACNRVGMCYDEAGECKPLDPAKARMYYTKSCDGGDAMGCGNLGDCFHDGSCAEKDEAKAFEYYVKGCDRGDEFSCNGLGKSYENGAGTAQNPAAAKASYSKSCDGGNATGCGLLGACLDADRCGEHAKGAGQELRAKACAGGAKRYCGTDTDARPEATAKESADEARVVPVPADGLRPAQPAAAPGATGAPTAPSEAPPPHRFVDNGNGTATDTKTKLIWQRENSGKELNWTDAKDYCTSLTLGNHRVWRLPTEAELLHLRAQIYSKGARSRGFFSDDGESYWSATTSASNAWLVHFYGGNTSVSASASSNRVRCVRW